MKLAIALEANQKDVCPAFGRAPYFMIRDTETGETRLLENPAAAAEGGAGPKAAQAVIDAGAEVLIAFRLGQNAAKVLNAADIQLFAAAGQTAEDNIRAWQEKKLAPLTEFHAGFHGKA